MTIRDRCSRITLRFMRATSTPARGWSADPARGRRVVVTHGRSDRVLSYDTTEREIVPLLQSEGAAVAFLPFAGGHEMPQAVKEAALEAALGPVHPSSPPSGPAVKQ